MFMHGTAYYRHPFHPQEKYWEQDFKLIKECGLEYIRIWVPWNDVERKEGVYQTDRYERMLGLANQTSLKVIANLFLETAPYWAFEKFKDGQYRDRLNHTVGPGQFACYPGGGWPGLCFDHPGARQAAENFILKIVKVLKGCAAFALWDIWNEPLTEAVRGGGGTWSEGMIIEPPKYCYCQYTKEAFRKWLREKYGEIEKLNTAWGTTYAEWELVNAPSFPRVATSWTDWKIFLMDRLAEQAKWKTDTVKSLDANHPVILHSPSFCGGPTTPEQFDVDDWRLQAQVDGYGVSFYPTIWFTPLKPDPAGWMYVFDGTRSACKRSKRGQYHLGEMQCTQSAGVFMAVETPIWQLWLAHMATLACANSGIIYWQWRPEELGPEASFYGLVGTDGIPKAGAKLAKKFSELLKKISRYWEIPQVKSKVAILFDPKIYFHCFADGRGREGLVRESLEGFYKLCWDLDVPVDIIHEEFLSINELSSYESLIMPFPLQIQEKTAKLLKQYVQKGGKIIAEAYLGRFKDLGWAAEKVPCYGLDEVFGCRVIDAYAQEKVEIKTDDTTLYGGILKEMYEPMDHGRVIGRHNRNEIAIVQSSYGEGSTLLIGTLLGREYNKNRNVQTRKFIFPYIKSELVVNNVSSPTCFSGRLVHCQEVDFLFLLNFGDSLERPKIHLPQSYSKVKNVESEELLKLKDLNLNLEIPPRKAKIILLER